MNPLNYVRVRDRELSLWQSAVAENIRSQLETHNAPINHSEVLKHPLSIAAAAHVEAAGGDPDFNFLPPVTSEADEIQVYLSHLGFQMGRAMANQDQAKYEALLTTYRNFSDEDLGFLSCVKTYAQYLISSWDNMTYNDWTKQGNNDINYGVIDWKLPNDAKVAVIGDWGTGMPDAVALLRDIMTRDKKPPQAIIHLGDIYYSGTPDECKYYFSAIFQQVFDEVLGTGNRIPVFTIPGNHDYYAWGAGYYSMVQNLNNHPGISNAVQPASYFCLRTQDMGWQFLGMDTGYNDSSPSNQKDPVYAGPWLEDTEITWLRDKMDHFNGATILLSHHQVFSANAAINGMYSPYSQLPFFNPYIYKVFLDYLPNRVAGWIWGHEHNFAMYANNLFGVAKGRLLGNSAYEENTSANPYQVNYPEVPYLVPEPEYNQYKLGTNLDKNGVAYYNHGFAIIDLGSRKNPTDAVEVRYYQFPAWGDQTPVNPKSTLLFSEPFALPVPPERPGVSNYDFLSLSSEEGLVFAEAVSDLTGVVYPTLCLLGGKGTMSMGIIKVINGRLTNQVGIPIQHGDTVILFSHKNGNGLTVGNLAWLYYSIEEGKDTWWTVQKRDMKNNDPNIYYGDEVSFISQYYPDQWLVPSLPNDKLNNIYLTTALNANYFWMMHPMDNQQAVGEFMATDQMIRSSPVSEL
jgi:hypothetical protein